VVRCTFAVAQPLKTGWWCSGQGHDISSIEYPVAGGSAADPSRAPSSVRVHSGMTLIQLTVARTLARAQGRCTVAGPQDENTVCTAKDEDTPKKAETAQNNNQRQPRHRDNRRPSTSTSGPTESNIQSQAAARRIQVGLHPVYVFTQE